MQWYKKTTITIKKQTEQKLKKNEWTNGNIEDKPEFYTHIESV